MRSWSALEALSTFQRDVQGAANAYARTRLFGGDRAPRVTLYRDNHAWCPYCEKVWLFLEEKRIPYVVQKITMFCYGEKERSYKKLVPNGMLPALRLDGRLITESDDILVALEREFGALGVTMSEATALRRLERTLFRSWCAWLCYPNEAAEEAAAAAAFERVAAAVEKALGERGGPFFMGEELTVADVVFVPYVERMSASLYYYKGYLLRDEERRPNLCKWFDALEARTQTYRGMQSDFATHAHDLPPQMGGCYASQSREAIACRRHVDEGPYTTLPDVRYAEPADSRAEALEAVLRHRRKIVAVNPASDEVADAALRCALTALMTSERPVPPAGGDVALRYVRDRISVPRDMSVWAARRLKEALEEAAALAGDASGPPIPTRHRRDQDPVPFGKKDDIE